MAKRNRKDGVTVVIRRVEEGAAGHHGGAWKVAYADFVTAMMAFFLLMWLINATSEQQRRGIAAYFSPMAKVENGFSGSGLVPGGVSPLDKGTSLVNSGSGSPPSPTPNQQPAGQTIATQTPSPKPEVLDAPADGTDEGDGARTTSPDQDDDDRQAGPGATAARDGTVLPKPGPPPALPLSVPPPAPAAAAPAPLTATPNATPASAMTPAAEQQALGTAAEAMRRAVAADRGLSAVAGQMAIDVTADGLRIQIMDGEHRSMFARGEATLDERAAALLRKVAPFLATLPEPLSIGGYTDAAAWPPGPVDNWTLSSGRAEAARVVLVGSGLPDARITDVSGFADRRPLLPADPMAAANRRVVLTLHRLRVFPPATGA